MGKTNWILLILLVIPISEVTRGQLLSLVGVVLTGVIALSSTSFVANIMAGLQNLFVQIKELGDFSISYRIARFLPDVKHILTSRSDLRKLVVDVLHGDGIEIVSPNFMNQRVLPEHLKVIPSHSEVPVMKTEAHTDQDPEEMIFDKAEEAEALERLQEEYTGQKQDLEKLEKDKKSAPENEQPRLETKIQVAKKRLQGLKQQLEDTRTKPEA